MNNNTSTPAARGCTVRCELRDDIVEIAITGLLVTAHAMRLHDVLRRHLRAGTHLRGVVVDLRRAVMLLDDDFLPLHGIDEATVTRPRSARARPVAVIVTREVESRFLPWAWEMAAAGLVRAAFVDRDEAFDWVRARFPQPA